jgi:hypothetical protein
VLSTRTAVEATQGALRDSLRDLPAAHADDAPADVEADAPQAAPRPALVPVLVPDALPDIRPAEPRRAGGRPLTAERPPRDESAAGARIEREVRAYARALAQARVPRADALHAVQTTVREGAATLPPDELDVLAAAAHWAALSALTTAR